MLRIDVTEDIHYATYRLTPARQPRIDESGPGSERQDTVSIRMFADVQSKACTKASG